MFTINNLLMLQIWFSCFSPLLVSPTSRGTTARSPTRAYKITSGGLKDLARLNNLVLLALLRCGVSHPLEKKMINAILAAATAITPLLVRRNVTTEQPNT